MEFHCLGSVCLKPTPPASKCSLGTTREIKDLVDVESRGNAGPLTRFALLGPSTSAWQPAPATQWVIRIPAWRPGSCQCLCIAPGGDHACYSTELLCGEGNLPECRGNTDPFCMAMKLTKEPFCSAWGGRREEKGETTRSKGLNQYLQPA